MVLFHSAINTNLITNHFHELLKQRFSFFLPTMKHLFCLRGSFQSKAKERVVACMKSMDMAHNFKNFQKALLDQRVTTKI